MSLFEQKYPNNIRTIIGLLNVPFQDDVVLQCDTTLGAVGIQLQPIPANYWSTQYKLYVNDKSNNASLNNITITAPVGCKINGASSVVISANGGSYLVRVSSNTDYIGQYSSGTGGSGYNLIQDETIPLTPRTTINFTGAGVTAIDDAINNRTNVIVTGGAGGGLISLTNAQMLTLISTNAVIPAQFYLITDAELTDGGLVVQGIETNNLTTLQGSGLFLDADYQNIGNYSGVTGFAGWKNIWTYTSPPPIVIGDVVIWNNLHFKNLTGVYYDGINSPESDPINWQVLPKTLTNGYIRAVDFVKYSVVGNKLRYRADVRLNEVDRFVDNKAQDSIKLFQWGRNKAQKNKLVGESMMVCTNSYATFGGNILHDSYILDKTGTLDAGEIYQNRLSSYSTLDLGRTGGSVWQNELSGNSQMSCGNSEILCSLSYNILSGASRLQVASMTEQSIIVTNTLIGEGYVDITTVIRGGAKFQRNYFSNRGNLTANTIFSVNIMGCEVSDVYANIGSPTDNKIERKVRKGYSNWETLLEFTNPLIWNGTDLTIDPIYNYIGVFILNNANPLTPVVKIVQMPTNHPCRFTPSDTQQCGFQHTLVGVSVADNLLCDAPASLNVITGRLNGADFIEYQTSGTKNIRTNLVLLA